MSIAAWIVSAYVEIGSDNTDQAYKVLMDAYESKKISYPRYLDPEDFKRFKSQPNLESFLMNDHYELKKSNSSLTIIGGDIDVFNKYVTELFETLAPYVKEGSFIEIEDEEEQSCRMDFKNGSVIYSGDAC